MPNDPYDELISSVVKSTPARRGRYDVDTALDLIARHESGGRNIKQQIVPAGGGYNPSVGRVTGPSTASGPWQITNSTWRKRAPREIAQRYPTAMSAPVDVQRAVAGKIFRETGFQDWAPYNASLRKAIARGEQPQQPADDPYDSLIGEVLSSEQPTAPPPVQPRTFPRGTTKGTASGRADLVRPRRQPQGQVEASGLGAPPLSIADFKQRDDAAIQQSEAVRQQVRRERMSDAPAPARLFAQGMRMFGPQGTPLLTAVREVVEGDEALVNEEVERRLASQRLAETPEVVEGRKEFGSQSAPVRALTMPAGRAGAGLVKTLAGLSSIGGIAPNEASDYLNKRAAVLEQSASLAPLDAAGAEVQRGLPEKGAGAVLDVGFTVAQLVAMKKATGLSLSKIMMLETALKTSDLPAKERAAQVAQAGLMGRALDVQMSRAGGAAANVVPTLAQEVPAVAAGQRDPVDAAINTAVQAGTGALLTSLRRTPQLQPMPDAVVREAAPTLRPSELAKRVALRGEVIDEATTKPGVPALETTPIRESAAQVQPDVATTAEVSDRVVNRGYVRVLPPVETSSPDAVRTKQSELRGVVREPPTQTIETQPPVQARAAVEESAGASDTAMLQGRGSGSSEQVGDVRLGVPETVPVKPQWQHRDFGRIVEADSQQGVPKGKVRVIAEDGSEHVVQRANLRGQGNNLAVPVREPAPPTTATLDGKSYTRKGTDWYRDSDGKRIAGITADQLNAASRQGGPTEPAAPPPTAVKPASSPVQEGAATTRASTPSPPPSITSARKEMFKADRAELDLPELPAAQRKSWRESLNEAKPESANRLADEVLANPRGLNDAETASVVVRAQQVKNEHAQKMRQIAESADPDAIARLRGETAALEAEFDKLTTATKASGTEKGRTLAAQKLTINQDFDLISVKARLKAAKGRPLTETEDARVEQMVKERDQAIKERDAALEKARVSQIQKNIDRVARQRVRAETKEALDAEAVTIKQAIAAEFARIKSAQNIQASGLAGLDPEGVITRNLLRYARNRVKANVGIKAEQLIDDVHSLVKDFVDRRQVAELISGYKLQAPERQSEDVRRLNEVRREIQGLLAKEDVAAGIRTEQAQGPSRRFVSRNEARLRQLQKQETDLARRIEEHDFSKPLKPEPLPYTREVQRAQERVTILDNKFKQEEARSRPGHQFRNASGVIKAWWLSSPMTQLMNTVGTGSYQAFRETARIPAVIADATWSEARRITGYGPQRSIQGPSPTAMLDSVLYAGKVGGREALETLRMGAPKEVMERHQYQEIDFGVNTGIKGIDNGVKAIELAHNAIFRMMSASDRVFYQGAYRRNLLDRATVQAKNEGVSLRQQRNRAKEIAENPSKEMEADAKHDALVHTFNNNNFLSQRIRQARAARVHSKLMSERGAERLNAAENLAIDLVLPFDRTPTNVISRIVDASPAGYVKNAGQLISAVMRRSMSQEHQRQFAQTFGNATTGTALTALGWYLGDKMIDIDDKGNVYLKIPGLPRINLRTASPVGNILAVGARLRKVHEDENASGYDYAKTALREPLNQPLLRATSTVSELLRDPERSVPKTGARYASGFIPFSSAVRFAAEQTDPEERRYPQSFSERAKMNVPVLRRTVPVSPSPLFRDVNTSTEATKELKRLDVTPRGATKSEKESTEQFEKRREVVNRNIAREINALVATDAYKKADDKKKREWISGIPSRVGAAYERANPPTREERRQQRLEQRQKERERREVFGRRTELQ